MSQQEQVLAEITPWILVSTFKEDTNPADLERITPQIKDLIDGWHSQGRVMWSGSLNDNKTGMAVFEATEQEANKFYDRYHKICSGVLEHFLYQWDAMPLLSFLSIKN
jgi:hypothetical protein